MSSPSKITKSIFWLATFGGLGYVLMIATARTDDDYKKIGKHYPGLDKKTEKEYNKNQQFMNVIQSAAESDKPLYRLSKEEIEKTVDK